MTRDPRLSQEVIRTLKQSDGWLVGPAWQFMVETGRQAARGPEALGDPGSEEKDHPRSEFPHLESEV